MSQSNLSAVKKEDPFLFEMLCDWLEEFARINRLMGRLHERGRLA